MTLQPSPQSQTKPLNLQPQGWEQPPEETQEPGTTLRMEFQWANTTLDVGHYDEPQEVTLGPHPLNDFTLSMDEWDKAPYPILVKEGPFGYSFFFTDSFQGSYTTYEGETYQLSELKKSLGSYDGNGYQGYVLHLEPGDTLEASVNELQIFLRFITPIQIEATPYAKEREYLWWRMLSFSAIAHFCVILLFQFAPSGASALRPTQLLGRFSTMIPAPAPPTPRKKDNFKLKKKKPKPRPRVVRHNKRRKVNNRDNQVSKTRNVKKVGVLGALQNFGSGKGDIFGKMNTQQWLGNLITATGGTTASGPGFGRSTCMGINCTGGQGGDLYGNPGQFGSTRPGTYTRDSVRNIQGRKAKKTIVKIVAPNITLQGTLTKEEIARVVRAHLYMIKFCYERELRKNPKLDGKIALRWIIAGTGYVQTVAVKASTMNNERVENCLVRKVRRWKFPQPRGNGIVIVNYPFFFNKAG